MAFKLTRVLALSSAIGVAGLAAAAFAQPAPSSPGHAQAGAERGPMGHAGMGERHGRAAMTAQDREAMMAARLAALKAGLVLTPEQEKLWPPIEAAARESMKQREALRARYEKEAAAGDPLERMRRMGEMASARGAAMTKFADAAAPLYKTLSDDQKRRLERLGGGMGMGGMGMGMGMGMGPGESRMGRGEGRHGGRPYHEHRHGHDGEGRGQHRL